MLGDLLVEGIEAHKSYTNFPGYDIVAIDSEEDTACRIQVKSRWATDFDGTFVVFVALNRGYRYRRKRTGGDVGRKDPQFYVFPVGVIRGARDPGNK